MDEQYKIQLGVKLDTDDIKSQINAAEAKVDPIKIKIDAETKELTNTIREALKSLTSGTKSALTLDTTKIEASLKDVATTIKDIRTSLGTLDSKSGMKSLLSSINQISTALEKASNKFEDLNANLKVLSGKDLNLNFGINLGGSNSVARQGVYGSHVRSETLPQLKKQVDDLVKYYNSTYKEALNEFEALQRMVSGTKLNNGDFFESFLYGKDSVASRMGSGSLSSQMQAYKAYIDMFKQAASLKGFDVSSVTSSFSKSADDLIKDAQDIQTGAKEMEDSFDKLKQIFGGGNNLNIEGLSSALEPIIADLGEIRKAVESLSKGVSIDGLTQSFDRLSETLEKLMTNAKLVQDVLGDGFSNTTSTNNAVKAAQQTGQKIGDTISKSAQQSLNIDDVIDKQVTDLMEKYAIAGKKGSKAFEEIKQAIVDYRRELALADNTNIDPDDVFGTFSNSSGIRQVTSSLTSHIKVANEAKESYKELLEFIKLVNTSGAKVHLPDTIKQEYGDDFSSMRSRLGKAFTTGNGQDFEDFVRELNSLLGNTIDLSQGAEAAFGDLVNKLSVAKGKNFLSGDELFGSGYLKFDEVENDITSAVNAIDNAFDKISKTTATSNIENNLKQVTVSADNTADAIESIRNAMSSMKFNTSSIDAATKDLEEMNIVIKEVTAKQGKNFDITVKGINDVGEAVNVIKRFNAEAGNFDIISTQISKPFNEGAEAAKRFKKEAEQAKNIKLDIEAGKYDNQMSQMYERFDKLSKAADDLRDNITQVENAYSKMNSAAKLHADGLINDEQLVQAQREYATALEKTNNLIRIQAREEAAVARARKLAQSKDAVKLDTENWLKENTKAVKKYGDELKELLVLLDKAKDQAAVNNIASKIDLVKKRAKNTGDIGLTLWDKLIDKVKEYSVYISAADVFMWAEQGLREMFNTVKEIDTAMTGLYRVTDLTAAQYDSLFNDMINSAKEYGATLNDIINATTDWVRAGFDADTALGLAEVTTMYQHISDLDYDTAAENLITAYNGFKDELNGAFSGDQVAAVNYIADILNELDNNFAITSAGLGEALTRSASALDLAGNTIQETAGMITGITEVTQNPEEAGNTLKILSLRLRGMKGALEEIGEETDENVENISKMQGQILNLTKGKVNIFDGAGEFRSTYEIMKDISEVWDDLNSTAQADLLETIAGKMLARIHRNMYIEYI